MMFVTVAVGKNTRSVMVCLALKPYNCGLLLVF